MPAVENLNLIADMGRMNGLADKKRIVAEVEKPGASLLAVARRDAHDIAVIAGANRC